MVWRKSIGRINCSLFRFISIPSLLFSHHIVVVVVVVVVVVIVVVVVVVVVDVVSGDDGFIPRRGKFTSKSRRNICIVNSSATKFAFGAEIWGSGFGRCYVLSHRQKIPFF